MAAVRVMCLLALASLVAACGADGDPLPPADAPPNGITLSGEATIGIAGEFKFTEHCIKSLLVLPEAIAANETLVVKINTLTAKMNIGSIQIER